MRRIGFLRWVRMTTKLAAWRNAAFQQLKPYSDTANIEIFAILRHVLKKDDTWILTHADAVIDAKEIETLDQLIKQLQEHFPLAYLTSQSEFYGRQFQVSADVLIPRPETELMIETGLSWFEKKDKPKLILDVGTGSGCIALTLLAEWQTSFCIASDHSFKALRTAKQNAARFDIERIKFINCYLAQPLQKEFDLICANLPYIPSQEISTLPHAAFEPQIALDGGKHGFDMIVEFILNLIYLTKENSLVLLEIQFDQGEYLRNLIMRILPTAQCSIIQDLNKLDRLIQIEFTK